MFQAVRRWWANEKVKRVSRLFAFELTVVMIGVLAAQEVSNWAQRQSELREIEDFHEDLTHTYEIYRRIAQADLVAVPCLEERVDQIMARASTRQAVDSQLLKSARLPGMSPDAITPETDQLLRDRFGHGFADKVGSMNFNLRENDEAARAIDRLWFQFQRLDPKYGEVSNEDRSAAKDAAVRIKAELAHIQHSAALIVELTGLLGISSNPNARLGPVDSCDTIWRTGKASRG